MNLNYTESQIATAKVESAIRALFEVVKLTHCEDAAIKFVYQMSVMPGLPHEVLDGIDWFTDARHDAAWVLNTKLTAEARENPIPNDIMTSNMQD